MTISQMKKPFQEFYFINWTLFKDIGLIKAAIFAGVHHCYSVFARIFG